MDFLTKLAHIVGFRKKSTQGGTQRNAPTVGKIPIARQVMRRRQSKVNLGITDLEKSVQSAMNPHRPNRKNLYLIYEQVTKDSHLRSQLRTAHVTIQRSDYAVYKDGKEDKEKTALLKKPWFQKYISFVLDSRFWGHSVIEFSPIKDANGMFTDVLLIPRLNICPVRGMILPDPNKQDGIPYRTEKFSDWLIEVGDWYDLGLLESASEEIIRKKYSRIDWGNRSERYGAPIAILYTTTTKTEELDQREVMLQNLGSNSYGIFDEEEELKLVGDTSSGNAHSIYLDNIRLCDEYISKLINGQQATSDQKAFVGAAEVQERLLSDYKYDRLYFTKAHVESVLYPFLVRHGYPLEGCDFEFIDLVKKDDEGKDHVTDDSPSKDRHVKKNDKIERSIPSDLLTEALKRIHDRRIIQGDIDVELWEENVNRIMEGVQNVGFDTNDYGDKFELSHQFKRNVQTFAAFKRHKEIGQLVDLLTDEVGRVRTFAEFREDALPLTEKYNKDWLESEYNHAIAVSQTADSWLDFERDKDIFPLLQYVTQNDARVRNEHKLWDGLTLPVEHPFWDAYAPPNGWGCRCMIQQLEEGEGDQTPEDELPDLEDVPEQFRHNAAKQGEIFNSSHPYLSGLSNDEAFRVVAQKNRLVYDTQYGDEYTKLTYEPTVGGYAVQHESRDNQGQTKAAKEMAQSGYTVELLEDGTDRPDAVIDGLVYAIGDPSDNWDDAIKKAESKARRLLLLSDDLEDIDDLQQAAQDSSLKGLSFWTGTQWVDIDL